jgi:glycosyltransferase involved in cell wall biosynthesis
MKILLIVPSEYKGLGWGGVLTYTLLLAHGLRTRRHGVTVLTPGRHNEKHIYRGIPIYTVSSEKRTYVPGTILRAVLPHTDERIRWMRSVYNFVVRTGPYDCIETSEWGSSCLFISLFRIAPVVVRLHRSLLQYYVDNELPISLDIRFLNVLEMVSIMLARVVTSPTKYMLSTHPIIMRILKLRNTPVFVIPNGIVISKIPQKKSLPDQFILSVGRLEKGKGTLLLVQAFKRIHRTFPNLTLVLIGRDTRVKIGEEWHSFKDRVRQYLVEQKLTDRVMLISQRSQNGLTPYYQRCLFYVQASRGHENHSFSILDAFRWGKAVIASNAGGIPETVHDGKNGLLFRQDDEADLAYKLEKLIRNEWLRKNIENHNREYRKRFDISLLVQQTTVLYETMKDRRVSGL